MAQRSLYREIFKNFVNSFKIKNIWGDCVGKDQFGTEYYERPTGPQGRKLPSRWFVPVDKNNFTQEIPPEWDAWLKNKRKEPPTEEEIQYNLQKMKQTIENAQKLEASKTVKEELKTFDKPPFPSYEDYEPQPGHDKKKISQ